MVGVGLVRNNNLPDQINQNLAQQVVEVQPEATSTPKVQRCTRYDTCQVLSITISTPMV